MPVEVYLCPWRSDLRSMFADRWCAAACRRYGEKKLATKTGAPQHHSATTSLHFPTSILTISRPLSPRSARAHGRPTPVAFAAANAREA